LTKAFQHSDQFGVAPEVTVFAPGRINILGEHLDYNGGIVLPAAINRFIQFTFSKSGNSTEGELEVFSVATGECSTVTSIQEASGWMAYFSNALKALQDKGYRVRGRVSVMFGGNIPVGAGMSSSAALCCGLIEGLNQLFKWNLSLDQIALLAQRTEHLTGTFCGLMDQYAVLYSKKAHVLKLDTSNMHTYWIPWNLPKSALILVNSKIDHQLAGTESSYNDRRSVCERALNLLKEQGVELSYLAHAKSTHLDLLSDQLSAEDLEKVKYVLEESLRVKDAEQAILRGDAFSLGALMYETHQGLSSQYRVSVEQTDFLVKEGSKIPGIYGSRMMGGGFGGCVLYLMDKSRMAQAIDKLYQSYQVTYGIDSRGFEVAIGNGVEVQ